MLEHTGGGEAELCGDNHQVQGFLRRRDVLQLCAGALPQGEGLAERSTHAKGNISAQPRGETFVISRGQEPISAAGCVQVAVRGNQGGSRIR